MKKVLFFDVETNNLRNDRIKGSAAFAADPFARYTIQSMTDRCPVTYTDTSAGKRRLAA